MAYFRDAFPNVREFRAALGQSGKRCVFADGTAICTCANRDIAMVIAYELSKETAYAQRARDDGRLFHYGKSLKGSRGIKASRSA